MRFALCNAGRAYNIEFGGAGASQKAWKIRLGVFFAHTGLEDCMDLRRPAADGENQGSSERQSPPASERASSRKVLSKGAGEQPRTRLETELANKRAGKPPRAMMAKRLRDDARHELQTWATT